MVPAAGTARAGRAGARRGSPPWLPPPFALSSRPLPHSGDCGPAGARAGSRSCGENSQTHGFRGGDGARFAACAHEPQVRQGPVRQAVSDPAGTTGAAEAHGRRGGSDPPRKRPSRAQAGLPGRSLPRSFLAGRLRGPKGRGGVRRRRLECHSSLLRSTLSMFKPSCSSGGARSRGHLSGSRPIRAVSGRRSGTRYGFAPR